MVRGSNPGGGVEIFRTRPDQLGGPPSLLYNGYLVFPAGKAAEAWRWPPTPSSAKVKESVELYFYSPSGPSWPVLGWTLTFFFTFTKSSGGDCRLSRPDFNVACTDYNCTAFLIYMLLHLWAVVPSVTWMVTDFSENLSLRSSAQHEYM